MCTMQEPPFARDLSPNTLRQAVADCAYISSPSSSISIREAPVGVWNSQPGIAFRSPCPQFPQFPAPAGFGLSQFVLLASDIPIPKVQGTNSFCKGLVWPLRIPWIPWTRWLSRQPSPCGPAPRSMFSYLLDPGTIAKAALPLDGLGQFLPTLEKTHRDQNARFCQYDTSSESNHCGFRMLLYFIML